jgi:hypothetical protein
MQQLRYLGQSEKVEAFQAAGVGTGLWTVRHKRRLLRPHRWPFGESLRLRRHVPCLPSARGTLTILRHGLSAILGINDNEITVRKSRRRGQGPIKLPEPSSPLGCPHEEKSFGSPERRGKIGSLDGAQTKFGYGQQLPQRLGEHDIVHSRKAIRPHILSP